MDETNNRQPWALLACLVVALVVTLAIVALPSCGGDQQVNEEQVSGSEAETPEDSATGSSSAERDGNGREIRREDFPSEEEYVDAAIEAAGKEADVPFELVEIQEGYHYVRGKVWIDFAEECPEARAREIVAEAGGIWVSSTLAWSRANSVEAYFDGAGDLESLAGICEEMMALDEVDAAYPEYVGTEGDLHLAVNDPLSVLQGYLDDAGFTDAWDDIVCEGSAKIALLDSGLRLSHGDLQGNVSGGYDAFGSVRLDESDAEDTCGHGTKVAGVACARAGNSVGVAGCSHNASLVPIRVTSSGTTVDVAAVIRALEYLRDVDTPDVVSMSFGMPAIENELPMAWVIRSQIQGLIDDLFEDCDVVVVASVGNNANATEHYPAKFNNVVGVGSVSSDLSHAPYSNANSAVDICAFGTEAYTTANRDYEEMALDYKYDGGTSFAAPQVAAAAALMRAHDPDMSAFDIELGLFQTAVHPPDFADEVGIGGGIGQDGKDDQGRYGFGVLDASAAVNWTPSSGGSGGGTSPFTGPGDDAEALDAQVDAQERLQATKPSDIPGALAAAMEANPDVFAWLHVPATNLSLPVAVRGRGDSFYLDHGVCGDQNGFGCAFSGGGSRDMADPVTVVYGHSFSDAGLAFTELHKFEDYAFFAGHEKVYLYLPGRRLEYRAAGANLFNARAIEGVDQSDAADLGDYFAELSSPDQAAFVGFKRRFSLDAGRDRILQLSTCTAPADPARRFVVTCVLEGERGL